MVLSYQTISAPQGGWTPPASDAVIERRDDVLPAAMRGELFWGGDRLPLLKDRLSRLGLRKG